MLTLKSMRLLCAVWPLVLAPFAHGVMCAEAWKVETKGDADYAAALKAVEREDWTSAITALEKVVKRRAWDDDAHTLLGFTYRKRQNYQVSVEHYHRALELNPYHRGALEYLGEAYVELGGYGRANAILKRLAAACERTSRRPGPDAWKQACPEWGKLEAAIGTRAHTDTD